MARSVANKLAPPAAATTRVQIDLDNFINFLSIY